MLIRKTAWWAELKRLLGALFVFTLAGALFSKAHWGLCAGALLYSARIIWQLKCLEKWLTHPREMVPEASGGLGSVLDRVHQIQRSGKEARSQLQAIIDRTRQSIDALQDAVLLVDRNSRLEWCNEATRQMLGLKYPEDVYQPIVNLVRIPTFKDYFEQKAYHEPLIIKTPMSQTAVQMQFTLFGQDDRLIIARDISQLKHLEQVRSDFVANVSHELKTPLTVLRGYLETMIDQLATLDPQWHQPIKTMDAQAIRMDALVDDLLLLSRLESGESPKDEVVIDIKEMAHAVREEAKLLAQSKHQTIELDLKQGLLLLGNYNEIRSALSNLVINAVKYTPDGGNITLGARNEAFHASQSPQLIFWVEDDGLGIENKHLNRLTERFYRVEQSRSTQTGGTGLGLAIVKHVLIRHQGKLQIESEAGKGSRFTCRFPTERSMHAATPDYA